MDIRTILTTRPRLGDGVLMTPQPSIEEIVRGHYAGIAGGDIVADAYLERIRDMAADPMGTKAREPACEAPEPFFEGNPGKPDGAARTPPHPAPGLAESLRSLGIDLRIGGVDVATSVESGSKAGLSPLIAAIGGMLVGAMANADLEKKR